MSVTPEQRLEMIRAAWYIDPEEVEPDLRAAVVDIKFVLNALREAQEQRDRFKNALIGIDAVTSDDHAREIALDALAASVPADEEQA